MERLRRQQNRGRRYRGEIDAATQDTLSRMSAADPPFMDQYEQAKAQTDEWLSLGVIAPEEILRWREACPGIWADAAMALRECRVSPRQAALGLKDNGIDEDATPLYKRVMHNEMPADGARWLLSYAHLPPDLRLSG